MYCARGANSSQYSCPGTRFGDSGRYGDDCSASRYAFRNPVTPLSFTKFLTGWES